LHFYWGQLGQWSEELVNFLHGLVSSHNPISVSPVLGITDVSHHSQSLQFLIHFIPHKVCCINTRDRDHWVLNIFLLSDSYLLLPHFSSRVI
jgi:hypothetical protein